MDMITAVRKERGFYRVTVNGDTDVLVPGSLYRERRLEEGASVDLEELDQWLMVRQYRHALDRAVAALASRAHSKHELEAKLLRVGYRPSTVEMVLYKLEKEGLLDDADFARQWVEARSNRRMGSRRIAQELRHKGIDAEQAEEALAAIDEDDQLAGAVALVEKALRREKPGEDPRKTANRILAMLARRGYGYDIARQALEEARAGYAED